MSDPIVWSCLLLFLCTLDLTDFLKRCLLAKDVDELTKSALFVTGLSDSQVKRDVRRAHPKTLQDAIRAARTSYEDLQVDDPVPSSNAVSGRLRRRGKTALNARRTVFPVSRVGPPRSQVSTCQRTDTPFTCF